MKIVDLLNEENVVLNLDIKDKFEIIDSLIDLIAKVYKISDVEKVKNAVVEREKVLSTGVGKGFAVPHGKSDAVNEIAVAFAITKEPVDFESLDAQPVRLIFLIVGRENMVSAHIKLLSRISRLMNKEEFRNSLLEAKTKKEVLELFNKEESNYIDITN